MGGVVEGEALRVSAAANGVRPAGEGVTAVVVDLCLSLSFGFRSMYIRERKAGLFSLSRAPPPSTP